jgi:hypothetical protein
MSSTLELRERLLERFAHVLIGCHSDLLYSIPSIQPMHVVRQPNVAGVRYYSGSFPQSVRTKETGDG